MAEELPFKSSQVVANDHENTFQPFNSIPSALARPLLVNKSPPAQPALRSATQSRLLPLAGGGKVLTTSCVAKELAFECLKVL